MSDLISPVDIRSISPLEERYENQLLQLLRDIRTELRVLNTQLAVNLNSQIDSDQLRSDPYYNNPDYKDY